MIDPSPIARDRQIGFLGLGWMGSNFAGRLLEAGWRLVVFDVVPERQAALADRGAGAAGSAAQVVREGDVVLTSLRSSDVFERVAEESLVPLARPGQVFVDLGTTRVGATREIAAALAGKGAALLDAPVSGDPRRPVYLFAGGDAGAFQRVRPVLEVLADPEHLTLAGPSGAGQLLKGVDQLSMGLVRAAWLEAISFASRQGIAPETIGRAVGGDAGWRAELTAMTRLVSTGKGEEQDLKLAELPYFLDAADRAGIELPLTRALFEFCDSGPHDWRDNMGRPYASFWHMLHRGSEGENEAE